jgi:hypothetical protein
MLMYTYFLSLHILLHTSSTSSLHRACFLASSSEACRRCLTFGDRWMTWSRQARRFCTLRTRAMFMSGPVSPKKPKRNKRQEIATYEKGRGRDYPGVQ